MQEKKIERKLVKEVKRCGGKCWKFVSPGSDGVPDRIALLYKGKIGFISAISHKFCESCNRVRLTSTGFLTNMKLNNS